MKKSSFLLYNYETCFFLITLKIRIKKNTLNVILKMFLEVFFVLNNKLYSCYI